MAQKPLAPEVVAAFGVPYTSGVGQKLTLLFNNRGVRYAEALGLNQPGTGEATNHTLQILAVVLPCQPDWSPDDVDLLIDIERSKGRLHLLAEAVAEARCKADPDWGKLYREAMAKLKGGEAPAENPPTPASE